MKRYEVAITSDVEEQIREAFFYIHERSEQNAIKWLRGLYKAIDTLETMPSRCSLIPENQAFSVEVRHLLYQSHRVIFTINETESVVEVHVFRHGAQDALGLQDERSFR